MSFLGRLLRAGSEHRLRLEDFLTEVLAELINALPEERKFDFCERAFVTSQSEKDRPSWRSQCSSWRSQFGQGDPIRAETQVTVHVQGQNKRPDLLIYSGEKVAILVECKVAAPFTFGLRAQDDDEAESHQLHAYDAWLAEHSPASALILLTHITPAPEDFWSENGRYKTSMRGVCRWSVIHRLIVNIKREQLLENNAKARVIAAELSELLEEQSMTDSDPSSHDIGLAHIYHSSGAHARVSGPIIAASRRLKPQLKGYVEFVQKGHDVGGQIGEGWIFGSARLPSKGTLNWGLWFWGSDQTQWAAGTGLRPNDREAFYVQLSFDRPADHLVDAPPPGWFFTFEDGHVYYGVRAAPARDFVGHDGAAEKITEWLTSTGLEAAQILESLPPT